MGIGWGSGAWKKCTALNNDKPCNNSRHVHKRHWTGTWYYMVLPPPKKRKYSKKEK